MRGRPVGSWKLGMGSLHRDVDRSLDKIFKERHMEQSGARQKA